MAVTTKRGDRWLLPLSGILLVMGGLLGVQVRTQSQRSAFDLGRSTSMLAEVYSANREQSEAQKKEIEQLRRDKAAYEKAAANNRMTKAIQDELQRSRIALGQVALKGPGIELVLGDSTMRADKGAAGAAEFLVVHDYDLYQLLNELWADGAEAISLNGQRIVSGSAIVCSGTLVTVNHVAVSAPFTFSVIGNQKNLVAGLTIRDGYIDRRRALQFQIKLAQKDDVLVPAISISPKYEYARPVTAETAQKAQEEAAQ